MGETRTRTGLLPLPPQSSVSTISPPPLLLIGIAKVRQKIKLPNFFAKIFKKSAFFCLDPHINTFLERESLLQEINLLSLRAFPREGKHR